MRRQDDDSVLERNYLRPSGAKNGDDVFLRFKGSEQLL